MFVNFTDPVSRTILILKCLQRVFVQACIIDPCVVIASIVSKAFFVEGPPLSRISGFKSDGSSMLLFEFDVATQRVLELERAISGCPN